MFILEKVRKISYNVKSMLRKIKGIISFIKESYEELKKVSWLTKKEMIASSIIVVIFIVIVAIYIGILDFILANIFGFFLRGRI